MEGVPVENTLNGNTTAAQSSTYVVPSPTSFKIPRETDILKWGVFGNHPDQGGTGMPKERVGGPNIVLKELLELWELLKASTPDKPEAKRPEGKEAYDYAKERKELMEQFEKGEKKESSGDGQTNKGNTEAKKHDTIYQQVTTDKMQYNLQIIRENGTPTDTFYYTPSPKH